MDSETAIAEPPYSSFGRGETAFIIICVSAAAFFSPVSSNIYFPALNILAAELDVSDTLINLTLTSFLVCLARDVLVIGLADYYPHRSSKALPRPSLAASRTWPAADPHT